MNRGKLRAEVRRLLSEGTANFFSDDEINDWLNEGVVTMTAIAQHLQSVFSFSPSLQAGSTTEYNQEYVLPADCDEIYGVTYFNGTTYSLKRLNSFIAQTGTLVVSTPTNFYNRAYTAQQLTMTSAGVDVTMLAPGDPNARYQVIGLYPIPSSADEICQVFFISKHLPMLTDADVPAIPLEYRRAISYFAAGRGAEKDNAMSEAKYFDEKFQQYAEKLKDKAVSEGQECEFPRISCGEDDDASHGFHVGWAT